MVAQKFETIEEVMANSPVGDRISINGFFRIKLVEEDGDGEMKRIVGDSGFFHNRIPNDGNLDYLNRLIAATGASKQISRMMLGTGTLPATDGTTLPGELATATYTRTTLTVSTGGALGSTSVEFQATFASAAAHITATTQLANIGIINDTTSAGTIFAGNTYATSVWNTNQDAQCTYRLTFTGPA